MEQLPVNADGFYIGRAIEHAVQVKEETGSCTLSMKIELLRAYDETTKEWEDITHAGFYVYGGFNLLGKDGKLGPVQQRTVNAIQQLYNWDDGELETLENMDATGIEIMVDCKTSTDTNGMERCRAEWIMVPEQEPSRGGMKRLEGDKLKAISSKHAAAFRAIAKPKTETPAVSAPVGLDDGKPDGIGF